KVEVALHGRRVNARYALFATGAGREPNDWMIHRMDAAADPAREPMPDGLKPTLASTGALPSDDRRWAAESKWDRGRADAHSPPRAPAGWGCRAPPSPTSPASTRSCRD